VLYRGQSGRRLVVGSHRSTRKRRVCCTAAILCHESKKGKQNCDDEQRHKSSLGVLALPPFEHNTTMSVNLVSPPTVDSSRSEPLDASAVAWEVHQAVDTLAHVVDVEHNVPALRRALRGLDRATMNLVEFQHQAVGSQQGSNGGAVSYPDYLLHDLQSLLHCPYSTDRQAQLLWASILQRMSPALALGPRNVETIFSLLLSVESPPVELQLAWLELLVQRSSMGWDMLENPNSAADANSVDSNHRYISNIAPWFERLYMLLQVALSDFSTMPWSVDTAAISNSHYKLSVLLRSCINRVLNLIDEQWMQQQSEHGSAVDILSWMQATLVRHLQSMAAVGVDDYARRQSSTLLEMVRRYVDQTVDYALDALDGAMVALQLQRQQAEDDASDGSRSQVATSMTQWAVQDSMDHTETALLALEVTNGWSSSSGDGTEVVELLDTVALMQVLWKQCALAFAGNDYHGMVARASLQFLKATATLATADEGDGCATSSHALDVPTLIMTLFRAVEACPGDLLRATVIWDALASELKKQNEGNSDLKMAMQMILLSIQNDLIGRNGESCRCDEVSLALGNKFLTLMNETTKGQAAQSDEYGWNDYFVERFAGQQ
jgi:hypothetical protein